MYSIPNPPAGFVGATTGSCSVLTNYDAAAGVMTVVGQSAVANWTVQYFGDCVDTTTPYSAANGCGVATLGTPTNPTGYFESPDTSAHSLCSALFSKVGPTPVARAQIGSFSLTVTSFGDAAMDSKGNLVAFRVLHGSYTETLSDTGKPGVMVTYTF